MTYWKLQGCSSYSRNDIRVGLWNRRSTIEAEKVRGGLADGKGVSSYTWRCLCCICVSCSTTRSCCDYITKWTSTCCVSCHTATFSIAIAVTWSMLSSLFFCTRCLRLGVVYWCWSRSGRWHSVVRVVQLWLRVKEWDSEVRKLDTETAWRDVGLEQPDPNIRSGTLGLASLLATSSVSIISFFLSFRLNSNITSRKSSYMRNIQNDNHSPKPTHFRNPIIRSSANSFTPNLATVSFEASQSTAAWGSFNNTPPWGYILPSYRWPSWQIKNGLNTAQEAMHGTLEEFSMPHLPTKPSRFLVPWTLQLCWPKLGTMADSVQKQ